MPLSNRRPPGAPPHHPLPPPQKNWPDTPRIVATEASSSNSGRRFPARARRRQAFSGHATATIVFRVSVRFVWTSYSFPSRSAAPPRRATSAAAALARRQPSSGDDNLAAPPSTSLPRFPLPDKHRPQLNRFRNRRIRARIRRSRLC
jgi:hypothetical protein